MSIKETYIENMRQQLDDLNAKMYALEAKAHHVKEEARNEYKTEIRKLRQQSQITIDMFNELKVASEDTWESMAASTEKLRDAFVQSFNKFK